MTAKTAAVTKLPKPRQELAKAEPKPPAVPAVQTEAETFLAMIERAARDPSIDLDRMERLTAMYERSKARAAEAEFTAALTDLQAELPVIDEKGAIRNKAGEVQSRYAKWEDINEAITPLLKAHGFTLTFRTETTETRVTTTGILRKGGHAQEATFNLPVDTGPGRNAVQSVASAFSYGKRYAAIALLNITSRAKGDADDDAQATPGYITEEQVMELRETIEDAGANEHKFCEMFLRIPSLAECPAGKFNEAIHELRRFKKDRLQKMGVR